MGCLVSLLLQEGAFLWWTLNKGPWLKWCTRSWMIWGGSRVAANEWRTPDFHSTNKWSPGAGNGLSGFCSGVVSDYHPSCLGMQPLTCPIGRLAAQTWTWAYHDVPDSQLRHQPVLGWLIQCPVPPLSFWGTSMIPALSLQLQHHPGYQAPSASLWKRHWVVQKAEVGVEGQSFVSLVLEVRVCLVREHP